MKLIDVLRKECITANLACSDKTQILHEVVTTAKKCSILKGVSEEEILQSLQQRESLGSTGFGKAIAIPHCRLESVSEFVVGIITIPDGVDFEALDGQDVNFIIFIIAPMAESNKHLKLLSAISQTLLIPGVVKEMLAESTPDAICESFLRHTRAEIDTKKLDTKVMVNVFVQDENLFRDILEKLTGMEASSLVIDNTENESAYLSKAPLFAGFWTDEPSQFSKAITLVIDKGLANEAIRRVESITGPLTECTGVLVTVHDLSYAAGSL